MAQPSNPSNSTTPLQNPTAYPLTGRCPCSETIYALSSAPLIVHACHCTYCQRESGSVFALNAIYEPDRVTLTGSMTESELLRVPVPTESSTEGQVMVRCPKCYTVIWSHYAAGGSLKIVRVGTIDGMLDEEGKYVTNGGLQPHAHIFAGDEKRHRWFNIPEGSVLYEGYGPREEYWPEESLRRLEAFTKRNLDVKAFSE